MDSMDSSSSSASLRVLSSRAAKSNANASLLANSKIGKEKRPRQAFNAPKDKHTKAIIQQNATTSPLLRIPDEIRERIFGYVIGYQLIHLHEEERVDKENFYDKNPTPNRLFNAICQAPLTEKEAYELSKSAEYDKAASLADKGQDMRYCKNRHAACYSTLVLADRENLPTHRLNINLLLVCRQTYVEAMPILWSTNTWSFHTWETCGKWMDNRNALQRRHIKKIHLGMNLWLGFLPQREMAQFKFLDEVNFDTTVNGYYIHTGSPPVQQFFAAKKITVIVIGMEAGFWDNWMKMITEDNGGKTWQERAAWAEVLRVHLFDLGEAERKKVEKAKLLKEGKDDENPKRKNQRKN